jgi:hypothetical protein
MNPQCAPPNGVVKPHWECPFAITLAYKKLMDHINRTAQLRDSIECCSAYTLSIKKFASFMSTNSQFSRLTFLARKNWKILERQIGSGIMASRGSKKCKSEVRGLAFVVSYVWAK